MLETFVVSEICNRVLFVIERVDKSVLSKEANDTNVDLMVLKFCTRVYSVQECYDGLYVGKNRSCGRKLLC